MEYRRRILFFLLLVSLIGPIPAGAAGGAEEKAMWYQKNRAGEWQINLYFYWSKKCPHCLEARPVIEDMANEFDWLVLHSRELTQHAAYRDAYASMAKMLGNEARSVPAFFYCGKMLVGFDSEAGIGRRIREELEVCHRQLTAGTLPALEMGKTVDIPFLGKVDYGKQSLLLVTVAIAALDAFNPCAFFVLLFLLSLLIHTRSRRRLLFIGGIFIFFSGFIYFLFMAAWLNVFLLLGVQRFFTMAAGGVAITLASINIKDFFLPGSGVSLSIPEGKKPGLFQRMRGLLQKDNSAALIVGTIVLAVAANSYELLCTSGLPMIYTRILTLESLSTAGYYLYLLLYNVIYIVPLFLILMLYTFTLGQRKLQAEEGQLLKLLSGVMMLELGFALLLIPESISSFRVIITGLLSAVLITTAVGYGMHIRRQKNKSG